MYHLDGNGAGVFEASGAARGSGGTLTYKTTLESFPDIGRWSFAPPTDKGGSISASDTRWIFKGGRLLLASDPTRCLRVADDIKDIDVRLGKVLHDSKGYTCV